MSKSIQRIEEEYWLALRRAPSVGAVKFMRLITHFGNPRNVFEASQSEWNALKLNEKLCNYLQAPDWYAVEKELKWLAQPNNHLLTFIHPDYPPLLREIADPPPILFVHGDNTLLSSQQIAIVGTRKPTNEGAQTAREFAEYLSHQGITITSGMALGIDGASHWGALAASGKTIAVAGTGLDRIYPSQHRELAYKIGETGALVSEWPLDVTIRRSHFPIRSRVVSGLCLGTLVIEAPEHSGALYAAQHTIKQGRELFAIPGSIHNPLVKGCHQLIKKGAKLVESAADILEELQIHRHFTAQTKVEIRGSSFLPKKLEPRTQFFAKPTLPVPPTKSDERSASQLAQNSNDENRSRKPDERSASQLAQNSEDENRLLAYLKAGPTSIDNLVEQSELTAGEVSSMLLMLELRGLVVTQTGGLYALHNNA
jgi:DNA processing protein